MRDTNFSQDYQAPLKNRMPRDLVAGLFKELIPELIVKDMYRTETSRLLDKSGCDLAVEGEISGQKLLGWVDLKNRRATYSDIFVEIGHIVFPAKYKIDHAKSSEVFQDVFLREMNLNPGSPWTLFNRINETLKNKKSLECPRVIPGWAFKGFSDCVLTEYPDAVSLYFKKDLQNLVYRSLTYGLTNGKGRFIPPSTTTKDYYGAECQTLFTVSAVIDRVWAIDEGFTYVFKDRAFKDQYAGRPGVADRNLTSEQEDAIIRLHKSAPLGLAAKLRDPRRASFTARGTANRGPRAADPGRPGSATNTALPEIRPLFFGDEGR